VSERPEASAAAQIAFIRDIQRLLEEGQFVASYKFALLLAIAELCLERETEADGTLKLPLRDIAARIIELYWPQVAPFRGESVLSQNTGRQAVILHAVEQARSSSSTFSEARRKRGWSGLVTKVSRHVLEMPLWRLQSIGGSRHPFLYEERLVSDAVELKPGVALCFRSLHSVVVALVQSAWIRYLHRVPANRAVIGPDSDLAEFLFGSERNALAPLRKPLLDLQAGRCFYCGGRIAAGGDVDHFIPWSRYPRDLGHNFVLAHAKCNAAKSDLLADIPHLSAWTERNDRDRVALDVIFQGAKVLHDEPTTKRVAGWAYENAERSGGMVWRAGEAAPRALAGNWRTYIS